MTNSRIADARTWHGKTSPGVTTTGDQIGTSAEGNSSTSVPFFLADAPRQARAVDAWKRFAYELASALRGLEEDEWLVLSVKRRNRFVQFMNQGGAGFRAEAVSDFYLEDGDHLSEHDRGALLELGLLRGTSSNSPFWPKYVNALRCSTRGRVVRILQW